MNTRTQNMNNTKTIQLKKQYNNKKQRIVTRTKKTQHNGHTHTHIKTEKRKHENISNKETTNTSYTYTFNATRTWNNTQQSITPHTQNLKRKHRHPTETATNNNICRTAANKNKEQHVTINP